MKLHWLPLQKYIEIDYRLTTIADAILLRITPEEWVTQTYNVSKERGIQAYTSVFDSLDKKCARIQDFLELTQKMQTIEGHSDQTIDILAQVLLAGLDNKTNEFVKQIMHKRSKRVQSLKDKNKNKSNNNTFPDQETVNRRIPEQWIWNTLGLNIWEDNESIRDSMVNYMVKLCNPENYDHNRYVAKIQEMYQSMQENLEE